MSNATTTVMTGYSAPVGYICEYCGSPHILFDAYAEWDYIDQRMVLHSTYDKGHCCSTCGGHDCEIEVDIETYEKALGQHWDSGEAEYDSIVEVD